ncbi:MAG: ADP-glyceromanno-heptose 6-epimerase [Bacteroidales bacterium]
MIIVTGAAGFIGSVLSGRLNREGFKDLVLVDDFSRPAKERNTEGILYAEKIHRDHFFDWLWQTQASPRFIFHIGARTDTTEFDMRIFNALNLEYSKRIWNYATERNVPLIYASSAATYGMGEYGYADHHNIIPRLRPLNPYGVSKNEFDKWVLSRESTPPFWAGMKFFNVYGPNEYHKGRMASVILHAFRQIRDTGRVRLFRSHHPDYEDGKQLRDFIYVKDVAEVLLYLMKEQPSPGIYNLGSGKARSFLDLARATFKALKTREDIRFIDTPEDIRDKYQYFTEAPMNKLRKAGYKKPFTSLEEGIEDYVGHYLVPGTYFDGNP